MNWEEKLNKFLSTFSHKKDIIGILVCGSYITGHPTKHSDLDVHIILDESVNYRERGNKIVDGLLIEYFANNPKQIRKYFEKDYKEISPMSLTQFITGKILIDKYGTVNDLKKEAIKMLENNYSDLEVQTSELSKYSIWDMLDDLEDRYEENKSDFDFIYYNFLDRLISIYMKHIKYPYSKKTITGNITSEIVRSKYLLKQLPDQDISNLILLAITTEDKAQRFIYYTELSNKVLNLLGGFDINNFVFKSSSND